MKKYVIILFLVITNIVDYTFCSVRNRSSDIGINKKESSFNEEVPSIPNNLIDNGIGRSVFRIYEQCDNSDDILKCLKLQVTRLLGRALKVQNIKLIDGVTIAKKPNFEKNINSRSSDTIESQVNNNDLDKLSAKSLDQVLFSRLAKFLGTHEVQIHIPNLLKFGRRNVEEFMEGRNKKEKKNYLAPFIAAVILKTAILKMAYHSIAVIAGKALIVGKIALIISAIIGLKKLVSNEGHEKTTYEIVKHPHVQQSHTYSSSHSDYEGGHENTGGSYHRSLKEEELTAQDKAYSAWVPRP